MFKEHLPVSERTNPFFGPTLPVRKDRPIWSYKFFDGSGGAFIMSNSDLVLRFPVGKIVFKGCGSKILNNGLNLLLLVSYIRYAMFIKKFIAIYGVKYVNLFRTNLIRIIVRGIKSILNKIGEIRRKIKLKIRSIFDLFLITKTYCKKQSIVWTLFEPIIISN